MLREMRDGIFNMEFVQYLDLAIILVLAILVYRFLKGSVAFYMLFGLFLFYISALVCKRIGLVFLSAFFAQFAKYGLLIITVIFQPEIRRILLVVGRNKFMKRLRSVKRVFIKSKSQDREKNQINAIVEALETMSKKHIGAIIVIQQSSYLNQYSDTGVKIYGEISSKLIESIFSKESPLHDGAVIIEDYLIKVAGCTLPVSENQELPERIGLRHKSAVGVTEVSDAVVFIVSEETGKISYAKEGKITIGLDQRMLREKLNRIYEAVL